VPPPGAHPDLGLLAAHAERRLSGAEAAQIDEHLAACSTCYAVFAETVRFVLDEEEVDQEPVVPLARRLAHSRPLQWAAVLLVAVGGAWSFQKLLHAPSGGPRPIVADGPRTVVAELTEAMGTRRFVEPRLTGGFQYGRFIRLRGDTPEGLDAQSPSVLAAVARIRERAQADTSAETLGALGITYLVSGDVGAAVKALESATAQAPENARLQSDLSAAYLVRANGLDEPADIPKGLEAAEKAVALKDAPTEAWFNRALALESLHLTDAARKAWDDYLKHDPSSQWADEARRHLADLPGTKQSTVEEDRARVRAALDEGPAAVNRLADASPAMLREYFDNELLSAWAEALLANRPEARDLRARARLAGDALLRTTGDALPRGAALAMGSTPSGPSRDPPRTQALGYRALRHALNLYEQQPSASCPVFREARRLLLSGGSPYAEWTRERIVTTCLYPNHFKPALAELARIEVVAEQNSYIQLLGRVRWMQGLIDLEQGRLVSSLDRYRAARASFERARDRESELGVLSLSAQNERVLAVNRAAWRDLRHGLEMLPSVRRLRSHQRLLLEAVNLCLAGDMPHVALQFGAALVEVARRWAQPQEIVEALVGRASIECELGADERAMRDLEESRLWMRRVPDRKWIGRLAAQVDAAEGTVLAQSNPQAAGDAIRRAIAYFKVSDPFLVPAMHLFLARALRAQGHEDEAEVELLAGIEEMEREGTAASGSPLQTPFFDRTEPLFCDMVRLQLSERHNPDVALSFVERARARQLVSAPLDPAQLRHELPQTVGVVYYLTLDDRFLAWTLTRDGSWVVEQPLPSAEITKLVAAQRAALEGRAPIEVVRRVGARLFDVLVRPLAAHLARVQALVFVPDAALNPVSFSCLWNEESGRYLVETYLVGMSPSGTLFGRASSTARFLRTKLPTPALIVGNPQVDIRLWPGLSRLPGAEVEARQIAQLYDRPVLLTGSEATKAAFLKHLRISRVVHFAGHATSSLQGLATSRLLLAPDPAVGDSGALFVHDIPHRSLSGVRVVVLAACRTASGTISRVEGALSLSRAFLAAGVPNVVGSLWDVDDDVSRTFFVAFHRTLLAERDPARALRRAQVSLLRNSDPNLAHPASWAGFVSIGGLDFHKPLQ
jgi:CHAT domain-containing protein